MRERKRKHDDAHKPAFVRRNPNLSVRRCPDCGSYRDPHLCRGPTPKPSDSASSEDSEPVNK